MTTRIQPGGPSPSVSGNYTAARVTPPPARPFKTMVNAGSNAVVNGAEAAVRRLPGGPVLAAAIRPTPGSSSHSAASPEGSAGTSDDLGSGGGQPGIEDVMSENADMNLYFLQLQEQISAESRAYTALSNVLKARHDTVKNAIGNIR